MLQSLIKLKEADKEFLTNGYSSMHRILICMNLTQQLCYFLILKYSFGLLFPILFSES
jgi:hypothetical protein